MLLSHIFSVRRLTNILIGILVGGIFLACSSPAEDDDDLPITPDPSAGGDTTLIRDTLPPDTLRTDTTIINPDTVVVHPDTTIVRPDTAHTDTVVVRPDTTAAAYITVAQAQSLYASMTEDNVSVMGYVVGTVKGQTLNGKNLTGPWGVESNILIADTPTPTDDIQLMPVELRKGTKARDALNLVSNPSLHHRRIIVSGYLRTYFHTAGLKSVSDFIILDQ